MGISAMLVIALYFYSTREQQRGGFSRNMVHLREDQSSKIDIPEGSYIAGFSSEHLYIGNAGSQVLLRFSRNLLDCMKIQVFPHGISNVPTRFYVVYPFLFGQETRTRKWFYGLVNSGRFSGTLIENMFLVDAVPIDTSAIVIKTWNAAKTEFVLAKKIEDSIYYHPELLEKQIDGKFCTDGIMALNHERKELIYIYYYRNEFLITDLKLNLIQRFNTIDTISKARITVSPIQSENSLSLSSPARIVNNLFTSSGKTLIVNSLVRGENESTHNFKSHDVFDVYNLDNGKYQFSFYHPHQGNGQKLRGIQLIDHDLFLLYDHSLYTVRLSSPEFDHE